MNIAKDAALHAALDTMKALTTAQAHGDSRAVETIIRNLAGPASVIPQLRAALGYVEALS